MHSTSLPPPSNTAATSRAKPTTEAFEEDDFEKAFSSTMVKQSPTHTPETELSAYLSEPRIAGQPLAWWKVCHNHCICVFPSTNQFPDT